jgi:hypothetical protein
MYVMLKCVLVHTGSIINVTDASLSSASQSLANFLVFWASQVLKISKTCLHLVTPKIFEIQSNPVITTSVYATPRT